VGHGTVLALFIRRRSRPAGREVAMINDNVSRILADNPFFHGLREDHLLFLARCARHHSVPRNGLLFREDDPAGAFYLIQDGRVTIEVPAVEGPAMDVQTLSNGEVLGWSWLIPPYQWNFQGRAETRTDVIAFDGALIRARCETDHDFGYLLVWDFAELMSQRLDAARQKLMNEWSPAGFA